MELMYSVSSCAVGPAIEDVPVNEVEERKGHASWDLYCHVVIINDVVYGGGGGGGVLMTC